MPQKSNLHKSRITHINLLMKEIHDSTNTIYECLIDREHKQSKAEIKRLIKKLSSVLESLQDDI